MDTEIAFALLHVAKASEPPQRGSGVSRSRAGRARQAAALKIGKHGQLQEWLEDYDDAAPGHRHISHLFALHPGNQITPRGTPELARAARELERRLAAGGGGTGWSRAWIINFWRGSRKAIARMRISLPCWPIPRCRPRHPPTISD